MPETTEDVFIAKLIKTESSRNTSIIILIATIVISAIGLTAILYLSYQSILESIDDVQTYHTGVLIGIGIGVGIFAIMSLLSTTLIHYKTGRKDRMLIKYYAQASKNV